MQERKGERVERIHNHNTQAYNKMSVGGKYGPSLIHWSRGKIPPSAKFSGLIYA